MSHTSTCPHYNASAQKCNLLRELQSRGSSASQNASKMYGMMGVENADWRAAFCLKSKWTECAMYRNEQQGVHR